MTYVRPAHFLSPKVQVTTNSAVQNSSNTANTATVINGSQMSYTPPAGVTSVVYEISFYAWKDGIMDNSFMLQDDSGGSYGEINTRYLRNVGNSGSSSQYYRWLMRYQWVIPAWSGSRGHQVTVASHTTNRNVKMHWVEEFDGTSTTSLFMPTHLIMYSI